MNPNSALLLLEMISFCIQEVLISLSILAVAGLLDPVYSLQRYMKSINTKEQTAFKLTAKRFFYNVDDWSKPNMIALGVWKLYFEMLVYFATIVLPFLICYTLNEIGDGFKAFLQEKPGPPLELVRKQISY
jgi:UDP-N-acetylmuramyl pentapeptide phosphotransferase/UDP-N-acetylglucosamine-1-phosphate transferase